MREIKFRAWHEDLRLMANVALLDPSVQNSTLMQYTGLKDKNGKEIYEGDVVSNPYMYSGVVRFGVVDTGCGCCPTLAPQFFIDTEDGPEPLDESPEVIGNIYENPELLNNQT